MVDPSSKLLESTEKSQWRWTSFTGADFFQIFFLVVFLGDGRLEKGDGDLGNLCVFFGGLLVFFWLAGVKGTAFLEQRPGTQTFFCGWKERCEKMVITTFKNVLSVAYLSPEQQRIAHIG